MSGGLNHMYVAMQHMHAKAKDKDTLQCNHTSLCGFHVLEAYVCTERQPSCTTQTG